MIASQVLRATFLEKLPTFSERFITGAAVEITLVAEVGDVVDRTGEITGNLVQDYDKLVRDRLTL